MSITMDPTKKRKTATGPNGDQAETYRSFSPEKIRELQDYLKAQSPTFQAKFEATPPEYFKNYFLNAVKEKRESIDEYYGAVERTLDLPENENYRGKLRARHAAKPDMTDAERRRAVLKEAGDHFKTMGVDVYATPKALVSVSVSAPPPVPSQSI